MIRGPPHSSELLCLPHTPIGLDHFLPAAFIGGFSADVSGPARERKVWVARRGKSAPYLQRAEKVGARKNLYDPRVDAVWAQSESLLPAAIEGLPADDPGEYEWHRGFVPFLAGLFVRAPEFGERFKSRLRELLDSDGNEDGERLVPNSREAIDMMRLIERQRLLAPVMYATWTIVHFAPPDQLITADVGYTVGRHRDEEALMFSVPLRPDLALVLHPSGLRGFPGFVTAQEPAGGAARLNAAVAASAVEEVYCPTRELAVQALRDFERTEQPKAREPLLWAGSYTDDQVKEIQMDWFLRGEEVRPWKEDSAAHGQLVAVRFTPRSQVATPYILVPLLEALELHKQTLANDAAGWPDLDN